MESIRRESSRMSRSSVQSHGKSSTVTGGTGGNPSRPSLLSKAYNSVSTRGSRLGNRASWQEPARSDVQKMAFSGVSGYGVDGEGKQKQIECFDGIFPVPHPDCKPTPAAKLTEEQQQKYEDVLEYFKSQKEFAVSLKPDDKRREPLSEWEKLRLLSKESILRYLRATKWDVRQAKRRLNDTIAWRREFGVENLKPEEMSIEARSGKETVLGYDKHARPVHYMHPHRSDTKESPRQMQFAVFILERCIDMMPPGVEQLALLINFEHKSRNPTSIANAKLMLYILQNHYVENLGVNWSVNVPWVFKMFWNAIQPFIDPVTKNKCHFDEPVRNQVPSDQLSADYGGDVDSKYDHDAYWPALLRITKERRDEMLRRFKEDCNSEIGASEWVIRGGDDPTSPFALASKKAEVPLNNGHGSTTTSTDNSSSIATPTAVEMRDSSPLEQFKTPLDQINNDPLERTFSSTTHSSDAHQIQKQTLEASELETTAEKPKEEEEATKKAEKEEQNSQKHTPRTSSPHGQSHQHTASTLFKEMDRKLHASKLFAAFHPDSRRSASQDRPRSSAEVTEVQQNETLPQFAGEEAMSPRSENALPGTHEVVAVAGAAGPQAAAGAVGSIVADQAYYGMQRVKSTAETNLAKFKSTTEEDSPNPTEGATLPTAKSVTVLFFAAAKEAAGGKGKHLLLLPTDGTSAVTLSALRDHLLITFEKDPPSEKYDGVALKKVIEGSKWSIDENMVDEDELRSSLIQGGETVAVIPPVSGG